ncbi:hypothetical protein NEIRO03_2673, partial [Nematocida sp. AWRm78]
SFPHSTYYTPLCLFFSSPISSITLSLFFHSLSLLILLSIHSLCSIHSLYFYFYFFSLLLSLYTLYSTIPLLTPNLQYHLLLPLHSIHTIYSPSHSLTLTLTHSPSHTLPCSLLITAHTPPFSLKPAPSAYCLLSVTPHPISRPLSRPFFFLGPPVSRANFFLPCLLFLPPVHESTLSAHTVHTLYSIHEQTHTPCLCCTHRVTPSHTHSRTLSLVTHPLHYGCDYCTACSEWVVSA